MTLALDTFLFFIVLATFLVVRRNRKRTDKLRIQKEIGYLQRQLKRNKKLLSESPIFRECSEHAISYCEDEIRLTENYLADTEDPPWCQEYWVGWLRHLQSEKDRVAKVKDGMELDVT